MGSKLGMTSGTTFDVSKADFTVLSEAASTWAPPGRIQHEKARIAKYDSISQVGPASRTEWKADG